MLLALSGCKVTVFKRLNRIGGRTSTIGDDRFKFDFGPTFFLHPRVLEEIFAACGRSLQKEVEIQWPALIRQLMGRPRRGRIVIIPERAG
jgi:phytoene desaturase